MHATRRSLFRALSAAQRRLLLQGGSLKRLLFFYWGMLVSHAAS